VTFVYKVCAFLPAFGLLTALLPDIEPHVTRGAAVEVPATPPSEPV